MLDARSALGWAVAVAVPAAAAAAGATALAATPPAYVLTGWQWLLLGTERERSSGRDLPALL